MMKQCHAGRGRDANSDTSEHDQPFVRNGKKVGRNEPCPCGSGKKYKQCQGKFKLANLINICRSGFSRDERYNPIAAKATPTGFVLFVKIGI